jgi:hypothetical protein
VKTLNMKSVRHSDERRQNRLTTTTTTTSQERPDDRVFVSPIGQKCDTFALKYSVDIELTSEKTNIRVMRRRDQEEAWDEEDSDDSQTGESRPHDLDQTFETIANRLRKKMMSRKNCYPWERALNRQKQQKDFYG